jgi:hypothetical protein
MFLVEDYFEQTQKMKDVVRSPTVVSKLLKHNALKAVSSTPIVSKSSPSKPSRNAFKQILLGGDLLSPIFSAAGNTNLQYLHECYVVLSKK